MGVISSFNNYLLRITGQNSNRSSNINFAIVRKKSVKHKLVEFSITQFGINIQCIVSERMTIFIHGFIIEIIFHLITESGIKCAAEFYTDQVPQMMIVYIAPELINGLSTIYN